MHKNRFIDALLLAISYGVLYVLLSASAHFAFNLSVLRLVPLQVMLSLFVPFVFTFSYVKIFRRSLEKTRLLFMSIMLASIGFAVLNVIILTTSSLIADLTAIVLAIGVGAILFVIAGGFTYFLLRTFNKMACSYFKIKKHR